MDLLKIKVENFRCFQGFHELDVTEGPLWVVKGENGSGKSTLICDSILFALFNTIPSLEGTQSLKKQELINIKSKSMSVQIWFNHNGNKYSIRRSYRLKGRAETLHHQFEFWENNKLIADLPRQDEARLLVSQRFWDIEDFRNTTIILQKEITNSIDQRESERKKSIEKIFNIERFTKMSELAHKHSREVSTEIKVTSTKLESIKGQLVNEPELQEKRFSIQETLKVLKTTLAKLEKDLRNDKQVKENLEKMVIEGSNKKEKIKEKEREIEKNQKQQKNLVSELQIIENELSKEEEYTKKVQEIEQFEKELAETDKILQDIKNKENEKNSVQKVINSKKGAFEKELTHLIESKRQNTNLLNETRTEIQSIEEKEKLIPSLTKTVDQIPLLIKTQEQISKQIDEAEKIEKALFTKTKDLELSKSKTTEKLNQLKSITNKLEELTKSRTEIESKLEQQKTIQLSLSKEPAELEELIKKEQIAQQEIIKLDSAISSVNKTKKEIQAENDDIKTLETGGNCPKCKQKLDEKHIHDIILENTQKITKFDKELVKYNQNSNETKEQVKQLQASIKEKNTKIKELDKVKDFITRYSSRLEGYQQQIKSLEEEKKPLDDLKDKFDKNDIFKELESEIIVLKEKLPNINELKNNSKAINDQILLCTKSEHELKEIQKQVLIKEEKKKKLEAMQRTINELESKIKNSNESLQSGKYISEELKQIKILEVQINKTKEKVPDVQAIKTKLQVLEPEKTKTKLKALSTQKGEKNVKIKWISDINSLLKTLQDQKKVLETELQEMNLEQITTDAEKYKKQVEALETKKSELTTSIVKSEVEIQSITDTLTKNNKLIQEYKMIEGNYAQLTNKKDDYDLLEKLFKDIGKRILNRVMSRINLYSTEILGKLGNDQLEQINLLESKNGFELKIISNGEERYPNWFSGGQKVRIGLAFRLSLSRTLAEVTGGDIETILIDEGDFGALDEYGLKGVAEILNELKMHFKRMVVVTHMDRLANELDGQRLLIKDSKIITEQRL